MSEQHGALAAAQIIKQKKRGNLLRLPRFNFSIK